MPDSEIEEAHREAADPGEMEQHELRDDRSFEPTAAESPEPPRPSGGERAERRDFKPASPAAVTEAIEEVNQIITSLKQVLDTMEEILETLELAEVQKTADEREIQSLRNALRNVDRRGVEPRRERSDEGRGDQQRGPDRPDRPDRRSGRR